jgi:hypothetical protein
MVFHGGVLQSSVCDGVVSLAEGGGAQGPFGAAVLRASMVEGSRRASWASGGDHLSRVAVPRCSNHHGGGCEGRECFCDGGFVSGMDSFGGPRGSWLWKA